MKVAERGRTMGRLGELARIPTAAKVVDVGGLNTAGLQLVRSVAARGLYRLRRAASSGTSRAELDRDGVLVVPNFLEPTMFEAVRDAATAVIATSQGYAQHDHGSTSVRQYRISDMVGEGASPLRAVADDPEALSLFSMAECRAIAPTEGLRSVEHVTFRDEGGHDEETDLHLDTFFHTHKGWLYLHDVTPDGGPLVYVPGSHRLDRHRLSRDYRDSCGPRIGSRRISGDEIMARGLVERIITCPANTLVLADTTGYHRRSPARPGVERLAIHWSFRFNPFLPRRVDRKLRSMLSPQELS